MSPCFWNGEAVVPAGYKGFDFSNGPGRLSAVPLSLLGEAVGQHDVHDRRDGFGPGPVALQLAGEGETQLIG